MTVLYVHEAAKVMMSSWGTAHKYGKMNLVKTTIEIPDEIFRQSKARAALRGEPLKAFVTAALSAYLEQPAAASSERGWRLVFGKARRSEVEEVDAVVAAEFDQVNVGDWE